MSILSYKKIQGKKTKEYRYYRIYQSILKIKYHITICWRCDCSIVSIKIAFRGADMKRQVIIKNCEKQGAGYTALRNPVFHKRHIWDATTQIDKLVSVRRITSLFRQQHHTLSAYLEEDHDLPFQIDR